MASPFTETVKLMFGGGNDTGGGPTPLPADDPMRQLLPKDIIGYAHKVAKHDVEMLITDAVKNKRLYSQLPSDVTWGSTSSAWGSFSTSAFITTTNWNGQ